AHRTDAKSPFAITSPNVLRSSSTPSTDCSSAVTQVLPQAPHAAQLPPPPVVVYCLADDDDLSFNWTRQILFCQGLHYYQSAEWLTLQGFPNRQGHDSRWQTEGVCHGSRYSGADGLYRRRGSPVCPASETRCAGATAVSDCGRARGGLAGRGGEDRWHGS